MGRWTKNLPKPDGRNHTQRDWFVDALRSLTDALIHWKDRDRLTLFWIRNAAAEVRAWRKSLPVQGVRVKDWEVASPSNRVLLRFAIRDLLEADSEHGHDVEVTADYLRHVEAYLRVFGKRLMDQDND